MIDIKYSKLNNKLIIIGENSRITKSLNSILDKNIFTIKKELYENWISSNSFLDWLNSVDINENDCILINKAIIDPNYSPIEINKWNYEFQINILNELERNNFKNRVYTTGSIFEKTKVSNNYLNSKRNLANYILQTNFNSIRPFHLRFHTLFGVDFPPENMFLGQIYNSIKENSIFEMSEGNQIRQYHHYNEVSKHLIYIFSDYENENKIIEITGKEWIKLRDIAKSVFNFFNCENLLKIGRIQSSKEEITNVNFGIINNGDFQFSPALKKINNYLKCLLDKK